MGFLNYLRQKVVDRIVDDFLDRIFGILRFPPPHLTKYINIYDGYKIGIYLDQATYYTSRNNFIKTKQNIEELYEYPVLRRDMYEHDQKEYKKIIFPHLIGKENINFNPADDTDAIAKITNTRLLRNQRHRILSIVKYVKVDLRKGKYIEELTGKFADSVEGYIWLKVRQPTQKLIVDFYLLDTFLVEDPIVYTFIEKNGVKTERKKDKIQMRNDGLGKNHFYWERAKPRLGQEFEIVWKTDPDLSFKTDVVLPSELELSRTIGGILPYFSEKTRLVKKGHNYENYRYVLNLLGEAEKSIIIVDSFIDHSVLDLIYSLDRKLDVVIITEKVSKNFGSFFIRFMQDRGFIKIYFSRDFHMRFMAIDEKRIYSLTGSIKELGHKFDDCQEIIGADIVDGLLSHAKIVINKGNIYKPKL